jgi:hypothetical protein
LKKSRSCAGTGTPVVAWREREREKRMDFRSSLGRISHRILGPCTLVPGEEQVHTKWQEKFKTVLVCSGGGVFGFLVLVRSKGEERLVVLLVRTLRAVELGHF